MVNDEIEMKNLNCDTFDKKQIVIIIINSTLGDELEYSLRQEKIINNCEDCSLKNICCGIDKVREDYIKSTSAVVKEFSFKLNKD